MCIECGCYGTVTPYGVGGRKVTAAPTPADVSIYNNIKVKPVGETEMEEGKEHESGESMAMEKAGE